MKTLSIIIGAALISGAAYGGDWFSEQQERAREWQAQFDAQQVAERQHEQLEEIQAQQRQIRSEIFNQQLQEQRYLRNLLEDCE